MASLIETLPDRVAADIAYQNARQNSDRENARVEHNAALRRALISTLQRNTELYKQYDDNTDFRDLAGSANLCADLRGERRLNTVPISPLYEFQSFFRLPRV